MHTSATTRRKRFDRHWVQLSIFELVGLISLLAIALGGITETVGQLPTEVEIGFVDYMVGDDQAFPRPYMKRINRYPLLVATVVASATVILLTFFAGRRLARHASPQFRQSVPLGAASLVCLAFVTVLSRIQDFDYLQHQIGHGDWGYVLAGQWIDVHSPIDSAPVYVAFALFVLIIAYGGVLGVIKAHVHGNQSVRSEPPT